VHRIQPQSEDHAMGVVVAVKALVHAAASENVRTLQKAGKWPRRGQSSQDDTGLDKVKYRVGDRNHRENRIKISDGIPREDPLKML